MTGRALVVQADALRLPLPDDCVDLVVTSPPYYALRAYATGGHPAELGSEAHWRDWLARLVEVTAEVARVLKPSGSIFVNLGDKYNSRDAGNSTPTLHKLGDRAIRYEAGKGRLNDRVYPAKSLMLLPERYRIACVDQLGLVARAVIVWDKPNGLPESVTDRVRRSHEDWVHLTRQPRYYSAVDEVREPHGWLERTAARNNQHNKGSRSEVYGDNASSSDRSRLDYFHPLGKLPGSVWSIPSEPLRLPAWLGVDHYAAFPSEWPRRLILGWSPPGICCVCGEGRFPVVDRQQEVTQESRTATYKAPENGRSDYFNDRTRSSATILGYACSCCPSTLHPERRQPSYTPRTSGSLQLEVPATGEQHAWPERRPVREWHLDGWQAPPTRPAVVVDVFGGDGHGRRRGTPARPPRLLVRPQLSLLARR